ncbi:MAG: DUF763 domain-containing protein [Bryobacteraceae bacterium]
MPLHGGHVPAWLAERMARLGAAIAESILYQYGAPELLTRLSDPFWFQALGCVMGMDWHSSGVTTAVLGALKRGLSPRAHELGIYICGGRGRHARHTPDELRAVAERRGLDGDVQQGMHQASGLARRYHWHSATIRDFTCEPHTAVVGAHQGDILNLVDAHAGPAQDALLSIARQHPDATLREARHLIAPRHHDVRAEDVDLKRLGAVLAVAYEREFRDFASLLLLENLGPRTLQSLALIAEVVHGAPTRFSDPARFSFALGGKDGHPFPVPLQTYDESIAVLRRSLDAANLAASEKLEGFARLDRFVRAVERRSSPAADFDALVAHERAISPTLGGRSVSHGRKGGPKVKSAPAPAAQLPLFPLGGT